MHPKPERLYTVDALRGIAAFAVVWYHFTAGTAGTVLPGPLSNSGAYGWMGVEIFFVISGFVIPYSLHKAKYSIPNYPRFILKRIIRLDPPYLVSIALIIGLALLAERTPGFRGEPFHLSIKQLLAHLGYANVLLGYPWLNIVYWTLAIEFQYYLLAGFLYPVISHRRAAVRLPAMALIGAAAFLATPAGWILPYLFLFLMGTTTFQFKTALITKWMYLALLAGLCVGAVATQGIAIMAVCVLTALAIAFVDIRNRALLFLGTISYSLYLVHFPISAKIVNLSLRLELGSVGRVAVLIVTVIVTLIASYLLYWLVEKPSQLLSSRVRYKRSPEAEPTKLSATTAAA